MCYVWKFNFLAGLQPPSRDMIKCEHHVIANLLHCKVKYRSSWTVRVYSLDSGNISFFIILTIFWHVNSYNAANGQTNAYFLSLFFWISQGKIIFVILSCIPRCQFITLEHTYLRSKWLLTTCLHNREIPACIP